MTRFARAQGSKASNSRIPEDATSWAELKQQLQTNSSSNEQALQLRNEFSKSKLRMKKTTTSGEWADFNDVPKPTAKNKKKKSDTNKKASQKSSETETHHTVKSGKIKKEKKCKSAKLTSADVEEIKPITGKTEIQKNLLLISKSESHHVEEPKNETSGQVLTKKPKKKLGRKKLPETVMVVDGREIEIELYDRFPVMKEDAARLRELKKKMIKEGIPSDQIVRAMKLERRRAEKALSRERKKLCFHCRGSGHLMSDCPKIAEGSCSICFKCGSTEHKSPQCQVARGNDYRYGQCFVCGEQGHIARQCPDNPRGLYPQGGSCKICGDVTHLKKDCPQLADEKKDQAVTLSMSKELPLEGLGDEHKQKNQTSQLPRKNKIIKF